MSGLTLGGLVPLVFLEPAILAALALLPILWWLLRATPPAPRRQIFPALRLLRDLAATEETPARTPWWVLLLRLLVAGLIIVALSGPVLNPDRTLGGSGPLLLVVDNGWASAADWPERQAAMREAVARAERSGRDTYLLTTAPPADGDPVTLSEPLTPGQARAAIGDLVPLPWPTDRPAAARALGAGRFAGSVNVVWVADDVASPEPAADQAFGEALQRLGGLEVLQSGRAPSVLRPPRDAGAALTLAIERPRPAEGTTPVVVRALAGDGRVLARADASFPAGAATGTATFDLPIEARNAVERLEIEGESSAASVVLLDDRWRRRAVGLVADAATEAPQPLLSPPHYVERALAPYAEVRSGSLDTLLEPQPGQAGPAMIVLTDAGPLTEAQRSALAAWVEAGGVAVRFAGPLFAANPDPLIPVTLRGGDRNLAGALSWTTPMSVAPFPDASPFRDLAVPTDVRVDRQVLAEPGPDLDGKVWARLTDGTPLVTGAARGRGWLVLVHTAADPSWSSLPLSGLFVDMLRRLTALGDGASAAPSTEPRPPLSLLDGFGRLVGSTGRAEALVDPAATTVGPRHPPGLYGRGDERIALNLTAGLPVPSALSALPAGASVRPMERAGELPLAPWLLAAALLLFAADILVALALRGLMRRGAVAAAILALAAASLPPGPARAEEDPADAADRLHLAYVLTGDDQVDAVSRAGLAALSQVLRDRTSADAGDPVGVDPAVDDLAFYPMLYWPVTAVQPAPSDPALAQLDAYLSRGGMIVFDTRDNGDGSATGDLQRLTQQLAVPPLVTIPIDHVLTRSFYLLQEFPGRTSGAPVWVASTDATRHDGVSSVVVGGADWAAAWATDDRGQPLFPLEPGGSRQRELAYRVGVNLVLYALTGNYKADQVHVPAILERLGEVR
jgi:hypothetical protein